MSRLPFCAILPGSMPQGVFGRLHKKSSELPYSEMNVQGFICQLLSLLVERHLQEHYHTSTSETLPQGQVLSSGQRNPAGRVRHGCSSSLWGQHTKEQWAQREMNEAPTTPASLLCLHVNNKQKQS